MTPTVDYGTWYGEPVSDGDLFDALLAIVYYGDAHSVRLEHHGTHASQDVICIHENVYVTGDPIDRRNLVDYAKRVRNREANTPIEPLPSPNDGSAT